MTSASRRLVFLALGLCFAIRLLFLLLPATPLQTKAVASIPDAAEYTALAENLVRHHVFSRSGQAPYRPEVLRTPGYPLFLAPFYLVFHNPLVPILIAQLFVSLLLVLAVHRFCLELTGHARTSVTAAFLVALSPNLAFVSTKLVTETLFTLLLVVGLILFNRFRVYRRTRDLIACGVCCGVLALIRPIAMFFPLLLAALVLCRSASPESRVQSPKSLSPTVGRWLSAVILVACAAVVILPWFARNARLTGRWILTTAGEHNLFLYNAATVVAAENGVSLVQARDIMRDEATARFGPIDTLDEAQFWKKLSPIAWTHVLHKPWLAAKVQLLGFVSTLLSPISMRPLMVHSGAVPGQEPNVAQRALALLTHGRIVAAFDTIWQSRLKQLGAFGFIVFMLALCFELGLLVLGLSFLVPRSSFIVHRSPFLWLLWPILYFTLLTGALGEARMRVPVEPLLAILAAAAIARPTVVRFEQAGRAARAGKPAGAGPL